jgi:hypothetical protein
MVFSRQASLQIDEGHSLSRGSCLCAVGIVVWLTPTSDAYPFNRWQTFTPPTNCPQGRSSIALMFWLCCFSASTHNPPRSPQCGTPPAFDYNHHNTRMHSLSTNAHSPVHIIEPLHSSIYLAVLRGWQANREGTWEEQELRYIKPEGSLAILLLRENIAIGGGSIASQPCVDIILSVTHAQKRTHTRMNSQLHSFIPNCGLCLSTGCADGRLSRY